MMYFKITHLCFRFSLIIMKRKKVAIIEKITIRTENIMTTIPSSISSAVVRIFVVFHTIDF